MTTKSWRTDPVSAAVAGWTPATPASGTRARPGPGRRPRTGATGTAAIPARIGTGITATRSSGPAAATPHRRDRRLVPDGRPALAHGHRDPAVTTPAGAPGTATTGTRPRPPHMTLGRRTTPGRRMTPAPRGTTRRPHR